MAIYDWEKWMSPSTKETVKRAQMTMGYTPSKTSTGGQSTLSPYGWGKTTVASPTQQYTGSVGGQKAALFPDLTKQTTAETAGIYNTSAQMAQTNPFAQAWENLTSGFQSLVSQQSKPFWEVQPAQADTAKKTMEDYQQEGWKVSTPYMPPPEYFTSDEHFIESAEKGTIGNLFTTEHGMTEQGIKALSDKMAGNKMVYAGLTSIINQGNIPDTMQKYINDADLTQIIGLASQNDIALPEINPDRLNSIDNEATLATLQNAGYEMTSLYDSVDKYLRDWEQQNGINILIDKGQLSKLNYESLSELMENLNLLAQSPDEMEDLQNLQKSLTLSLTSKTITPKGKMLYSTAQWKSVGGMTQTEYNKQQTSKQEEDYWSAESVAERNRRREESTEWSRAKELEGWNAFYNTMNALKMTPDMDNYFNNPTTFNDLRRQWEASNAGLSWEQWLSQYNFKGVWDKLDPRMRGERPSTFAPRMTGVSEL